MREVSAVVLARQQKQCNFLEYKDKKIIYKRSASDYSFRARMLCFRCVCGLRCCQSQEVMLKATEGNRH